MKKLRDWGIQYLNNLKVGNAVICFSGYSIIYSASDYVHLLIFDNEIHIEPETFYYIPPNCSVRILGKTDRAMLLWFTVDLFVDRLEFLKNFKTGLFSQNPLGFGMKNTYIEHQHMFKYYYLPTQKEGVNKLFSKNLLSNFLEYILTRTLLEIDPKMEGSRKDSYEKEIADNLVSLLDEEDHFKFNVEYYAEKLNLSKRSLDNAIKKVYGCTTKRFINAKAIQRTKKLLQGTDIPIKNISLSIGFSEESNFSNFFRKHTGSSPREYRESAILTNSDLKVTKLLIPKQVTTMKTNTTIMIIMVNLLLSFSTKAQSSEPVTLNVNLYPVQTIELNSSQSNVNLDYKTNEDYKNGVQITEDNHLKVYSTGGFTIKVKSIDPNLTSSTNTGTTIAASDITVTATKGSIDGVESFSATPVTLSTSDSPLIFSNTAANNKTFNINYSAKGGDKYMNKYVKSQSPTVYTTQVYYSIEPS